MPHTRLVDRVIFGERTDLEQTQWMWATRTLLRTALLYSLDDPELDEDLDVEQTMAKICANISTGFKERFFPSIKPGVTRIEIESSLASGEAAVFRDTEYRTEIWEGIVPGTYTLIHGPRGSGKSTVLRSTKWMHSQLHPQGATPSEKLEQLAGSWSYHYVNLIDERSRRRIDSSATNHPLCSLLYDTLIRDLVASDSDDGGTAEDQRRAKSFDQEFRWHVFDGNTSSAEFDELRVDLESDLGLGGLYNEKARREYVKNNANARDLYQAGWKSFLRREADCRLELLLSFLGSKGHLVSIALDNVDRYGRDFHRAVHGQLARLAKDHSDHASFLLTLRSSNMAAFNMNTSDEGSAATEIALVSISTGRLGIDTSHRLAAMEASALHATLNAADEDVVDEMEFDEPERSRSLIFAVIDRRLTILSDMIASMETNAIDAAAAEVFQRELKLETGETARLATFVQDCRDQLLDLDGIFSRSMLAIVPRIYQWHNYSIRGAAAQLAEFILSTTTGRERFVPKVGESAPELMQPSEILSYSYRQMLLGPTAFSNGGAPVALYLTQTDCGSTGLQCIPIRLMQHLAAMDGEARWGQIVAELEACGETEDRAYSALSPLLAARGWESEGMVRVVGLTDEESALAIDNGAIPTTAKLKLRAAGRLYLGELMTTVESLFWSGMFYEEGFGENDAQRRQVIAEIETFNDELRVEIAIDFVGDVLLSAFSRELDPDSVRDTDLANRKARMHQIFSPQLTDGYFIPRRATSSLIGYVNSARLTNRQKRTYGVRLQALKSDCESRIASLVDG